MDEQFGHNHVQLAMVYVYDVGITDTAVTAFSERATSEMARTNCKLASMLMHSPAEREEILYRRAMHERTYIVPEDDAWAGNDSDFDSVSDDDDDDSTECDSDYPDDDSCV